MKIGLDWAGVTANIAEAQRLVLMEMYARFENDVPVNGPLLGRDEITPFSMEYRKLFDHVVLGRAPCFSYTKNWVLEDKSHKQDGTLLSIDLVQYEAMKKVLYEHPGYPENIPEVPGAAEGITKLVADGHDVEIVTSRTPGVPLDVIKMWMGKRKLYVPIRSGVKDKTKVLHEYDIFIDDKAKQLAPEKWCLTLRLLFAHYYNYQETTPFIYNRNCGYVPDWRTILSIVEWRSRKRLAAPQTKPQHD